MSAVYRSKVNTSLKNKICFENTYFPSKFIKLCPESLKEHTDKISLRSDETQTFYWSFKYMSNYHLKPAVTSITPVMGRYGWHLLSCTLGCQVSWVMSVEVARFGMRESWRTHLLPDVCSCHVLRILAVAVCKIGDVCIFPAPEHQPFSSNSLGRSAPEEAYSRNLRASGTLKLAMKLFLSLPPLHQLYRPNHCTYMSRDMTKPTKWLCAQRRLRSAWASAQSDQRLRCPHEESLDT